MARVHRIIFRCQPPEHNSSLCGENGTITDVKLACKAVLALFSTLDGRLVLLV